ncbi:hypothetical protein XaraCFBP7407_05850 [Xanthomonas arboricola pv. arracaciae]|nr:hypothetical protein XaraCFBP7407_05850 [Xanthomonas arboricola pv. arracaciae]
MSANTRIAASAPVKAAAPSPLQTVCWSLCKALRTPTISTGSCPPTVAEPYAAWMPRKRLHGRTCGVSREGGRAIALQPSRRSPAPH